MSISVGPVLQFRASVVPPRRPSWADGMIVGESRAILHALAHADEIVRRGARVVLITGETGTGKELLARGIHAATTEAGPNASQTMVPPSPFLTLSCDALPEPWLHAELFGVEPEGKAGLLELAGDGVLFFDEVGALPMSVQRALWRVLERGTFRRVGGRTDLPLRARFLASSVARLDDVVNGGMFHEGLFGCLAPERLDVPPLRERGDDVAIIARYIMERSARGTGTAGHRAATLSVEAASALRDHPWPGNVRELKSVLERALAVCAGETILRRHLMFQRRRVVPASGEIGSIIQIPAEGKSLDAIAAEAIRVTLLLTQGNLSATARTLGISRPTLTRKIREFGILRQGSFSPEG